MNFQVRKALFSEFSFWIVFLIIGLYFILPLRQKIRFGMDLVGGTYLTLEVQTEEAVTSELVDRMQRYDAAIKKAGKKSPISKVVEDQKIKLQFESLADAQEALLSINEDLRHDNMIVDTNNAIVLISFPEAAIKQLKSNAVERNIEVLRTRMRSNIEEIPIASQGERNIIIELPDTANPQEAKARIGTSAVLELRLVHKEGPTKEDLLFDFDGELPVDKEILPSKSERRFYLVDKYADVTGKMLKDARRAEGKYGSSVVSFVLNEVGAQKFYEVTSKNTGRQLAIVLDGVVVSAPVINGPIPNGSAEISGGNMTNQSARELALLLTSGSYVAKVNFGEERQIGPTLGAESRRQGFISCLVGLFLLLIFSIYVYKWCGLLAFLALVYNLFLILIGLAWLRATLTLPGIAGMVLTIGMAIDASILIYERIKEELAKGLPAERAVSLGFSGAMKVILDANITTFIVGVVLYYFGTGPIQGFAVTMMLGILATLISGLFFLRSMFNFFLRNFDIKTLKI